MECRSEVLQLRCDKLPSPTFPRSRLHVWFIRVCSTIFLWACLVQLVVVGELWNPHLLTGLSNQLIRITHFSLHVEEAVPSPLPLLPSRKYRSNGYLKVSCNGGLNQMRAEICDMVTVARLLNLTLVVPQLDKTSFWADPRYAYPWWREKEIVSEERRSQGLCPLTPEEAALVLQALGFQKDIQIYIASGEIYGSERRLVALRAAFPRIVKKEMLLDSGELQQFQNHSSQMAALDFMVSIASSTFIPTYDGNMAKLVEGHRRYLGLGKTILLDRRRLVELLDLHQNMTLSWDEFSVAVRSVHEKRMGQPSHRRVIVDKPKEEDYFYANPQECL